MPLHYLMNSEQALPHCIYPHARALLAIGTLFSLVATGSSAHLQKPQPFRVLVVKTSENLLYARGAEGITSGLKNRGYRSGDRIELSTVTLSGDERNDKTLLKDRVSKKPSLIITLGTDATRLTQECNPSCPVVFTLILDPVRLGVAKTIDAPAGFFTGTTLLVPPGKQLEAFVQTSSAKRVGMLYTDKDQTSLHFIEEARDAATRLHVEVIAEPVDPDNGSSKEALARLAAKVDALWLIPDPASSGAAAFSQTIDIAREKKLPVLGASSAMTQRGALLSLSADIGDLTDLTAEVAARILDGTAVPATTKIRGPRKTILSINLGVAKALSIQIPDSILHLADEVIDAKPVLER